MPRPRKPRMVSFNPNVVYFKPRAVPLSELQEVSLSLAEVEALRLCDLKGFSQSQAASRLKVSQSTLSRTLISARKKIAQALVEGKAIKIQK